MGVTRMLLLGATVLLTTPYLADRSTGQVPPGEISQPTPSCSPDLLGAWTADLDVGRTFGGRVSLTESSPGTFVAEVRVGDRVEHPIVWRQGDRIRFQAASGALAFDGREADDGAMDLFIEHAQRLLHVRLSADGVGRSWTADWNLLDVSAGDVRLDLYVEREEGEVRGGYFFFRDQRLPALFGEGLTCEGSKIHLRERNLGLSFDGDHDVDSGELRLQTELLGRSFPTTFRRVPTEEVPEQPDTSVAPARLPVAARYVERAPETIGDGWETAIPSAEALDPALIGHMVDAIVGGEMTATHSVLVARHGRLVVEEYFYGFDRETWHDLRSAGKTIASILVGLAIREGHLEGAGSPALAYLPYRRYANWDARKAAITLRDLMTMASGLDANDYEATSFAAENVYQTQRARPDWVKLALDAPMIDDPGAQPLYGGANPLILGGVLAAALDEPLEWFAHRTLFGPLGVTGYNWFLDPTGTPYLGGGIYLRPRDVLKLGQLYLDGGVWNGERLLPESWVRESWRAYGRLAPFEINGHEYGYLWWHHRYELEGRTVGSLEARGYGGQYLFVLPELDLVAVVTAGNFRNRRTRQSEEILGRFIVPAVR